MVGITSLNKKGEVVGLFFLLILFILQIGFASPQKSVAFDEQYHLTAGYTYLATGDFRLSLSHPPLIDTLSALPLLWRTDIILDTNHPAWINHDYFIFSDYFLWQANATQAQSLVEWSRWPIMGLGVILLSALYLWAREMISPAGAMFVLVLATFDPNLLANARLTTTDLGLTCFLTLTIWRLWVWLTRPSFLNLTWVGLLAGLTMSSKFTGVMVWPMILVVLWLYPHAPSWKQKTAAFFTLLPLAYFALWATYRFDVGPIPGFPLTIPIPAPFYPYSLWDTFMVIEEQPKPAFLAGAISDRGWWYYFPAVLALKTPLTSLGLALMGVWAIWQGKHGRATGAVWVPFLLYLGLAMTGRIAIGYRHILPVVPFLLLTAGFCWPAIKQKWWLGLLVAWQIATLLWLWPHHEAYFNELAGGPSRGSEWLVDSNLDWGQDLILLQQLLAEKEIKQVNLAYFGTARPELYGFSYQPLPSFLRFTGGAEVNAFNAYTPEPGWYAISATSLRLGLMFQNQDVYAYFQQLQPVARAGYSIFLYEIPNAPVSHRQLLYQTAVSDVSPAELGLQPGQRTVVKWVNNEQTTIQWAQPTHPAVANFDGVLLLLEITPQVESLTAGETIPVLVRWQVGDLSRLKTPAPTQASPLAMFIHLSGHDPSQIVAQYDGWETALRGLEPTDIVEQTVWLTIPPETPAGDYFLRVGLYSPQTGQRLPLTAGGDVWQTVKYSLK